MERIRVFIIDDQIDFIKGILHLFRNNKEIEFVGYSTNPESFFKTMEPSKFDILLIDIKMPEFNGIDLITKLICRFPYLKTIIISVYHDFDKLQQALGAGAKGYLSKNSSKFKIEEAIKVVHNNKTFFQMHTNGK